MKSDIRPLCPRHGTVLVPEVITLQIVGFPSQKPAYKCMEPGCDLHYALPQGYFTCSMGGPIIEDAENRIQCPKDGLRMFIASFDAAKMLIGWQCSNEGCEGIASIEGSLR